MKKENSIELSFDKATTRLTFYPYGKEVYETQVKPKIKYTDEITNLVFPNQIVKASSSFVQGFFNEVIKNVGYDAIGRTIFIKSPNESLLESIKRGLRIG